MPGFSENFPTAQLCHTLVDFIDSENQYDPSDFLDAINAHRSKLLDPDPFGRKQRNATDRYITAFVIFIIIKFSLYLSLTLCILFSNV